MLTTEAMITNIKDDEKEGSPESKARVTLSVVIARFLRRRLK